MARVIRAAVVEAIQDAARIRQRAEQDAHALRTAAREEGLAAARTEAAAHLIETARLRAQVIHQAEASLAPLVRSVVERILQDTFEEDHARIARLLRTHLDRLLRAQSIEVTVHPDDVPAISALALEAPTFRILTDPTLARGDILLISDLGRVDSRLALHLDALEQALTQAP